MADEPKAIVEQYSETVEQGDWEGLRKLVTEDFVIHEPSSIDPEPQDFETHLDLLQKFDWRIDVQESLSEGNMVATREIIYGTQIEEYEGLPPKDQELSFTSILMWRIEDGKIAEIWSSPDSHGMLEELGVTFPQILVTMPKVLIRKLMP